MVINIMSLKGARILLSVQNRILIIFLWNLSLMLWRDVAKAAPPPLPDSCYKTMFTLALSEMTNENKLQAKSALVGLLGYVLVKYKPDKMPFPGESQRCHSSK